MLAHPLLPKLKALRLAGMADTLDQRAELARMQGMSPLDFLALVLDDEIDRRAQTRHALLQRRAGFESLKLISEFDFAARPSLDKSVALEMATCRFVAQKSNWLLCGPTGVGKSHLATAIGFEAIKRGLTTLCFQVSKLLAELFAARADASYAQVINKIAKCDLLILDDFGLRPLKETGADDLFEIIQARYERGSIIMTSNRSPAEWPEIFGNTLLASAALDRLTHHARITIITGDSYRQRDRRKESEDPDTRNNDDLK